MGKEEKRKNDNGDNNFSPQFSRLIHKKFAYNKILEEKNKNEQDIYLRDTYLGMGIGKTNKTNMLLLLPPNPNQFWKMDVLSVVILPIPIISTKYKYVAKCK